MSSPALSVVICTLNEATAIGPVLRELAQALDGVDYEIIVADDDSADGTAAVVQAEGAVNPRIRVAVRKNARGLASAAIFGWDQAHGRFLAVMDGDGQHDPLLMRRMFDRAQQGDVDLVAASRYIEGDLGLAPHRAFISRSGTALTGFLIGAPLSDPLSGCFLMSRERYDYVRPNLTGVGFKILIDVAASGRKHPRTAETPTSLRTRIGGDSKLDIRVMIDLAALLIEKRTRGVVPARFVQFSGVGVTGVVVHMIVLSIMHKGLDQVFWASQATAIIVAMTWNFLLNNVLTFRDMRLRGTALWRGMFAFYLACLGGAVISELLSAGLVQLGAAWWLAGMIGALSAGVFNFAATRRITWGLKGKGVVDKSVPKA